MKARRVWVKGLPYTKFELRKIFQEKVQHKLEKKP